MAGNRDGIEGAALLRGMLDIPVVFLTGQIDQATRDRALQARPPQQILGAVEQALHNPRVAESASKR